MTVFALEVERELDDWPERAVRRRWWVPVREAAGLVGRAELADLIRTLDKRLAAR